MSGRIELDLSGWIDRLREKLGIGGTGHACIEAAGVSEVAQSHAMAPRNYGSMEECDGNARITGPCGDTMEFWITVRDGTVEKVSFITTGCGPSLASGSMTTVLAKGKSLEEVVALQQQDVLDALQGLPKESRHCALLAVNTLRAACRDFWEREKGKGREGPGRPSRGDDCSGNDCGVAGRRSGGSDRNAWERSMPGRAIRKDTGREERE